MQNQYFYNYINKSNPSNHGSMISNKHIVELVEGFISGQTKRHTKDVIIQSIVLYKVSKNVENLTISKKFNNFHLFDSPRCTNWILHGFSKLQPRFRLFNKYLHKMFSVFCPYSCAHPHALVQIYKHKNHYAHTNK